MISLRRLLTRWLMLAMAVTAVAVGSGLYAYLHHIIQGDYDRTLKLRAHAIEALVALKPDGKWDVDIHPHALREYATIASGEFYRVSDDAHHAITASAEDPLAGVATPPDGAIGEAVLPSGVHIRTTAVRYQPSIEKGESDEAAANTTPAVARPFATVLVGRDRAPLNAQLWRVMLGIGGAGTAMILAALAATTAIVRLGFVRLDLVADQMATIDFSAPDAAFKSTDVPVEMAGVVNRFNQMLRRVGETLARERRFTADVAHELRTPIAELRTATEVAMRYHDKPGSTDRGLQRAHAISLHMQKMVTALLAFVRGEAITDQLQIATFGLHDTLRDVAARCDVPRLEINVDPDVAVRADAGLLTAVLENLLGNATEYATDPATVRIDCGRQNGRVLVHIDNAQQSLTDADLPHLFEPFWRKDTARTRGRHFGLGLSLSKAYCEAMAVGLTATLPTPTTFRITLDLPAAYARITGARAEQAMS